MVTPVLNLETPSAAPAGASPNRSLTVAELLPPQLNPARSGLPERYPDATAIGALDAANDRGDGDAGAAQRLHDILG
jgi:hypothetical protein